MASNYPWNFMNSLAVTNFSFVLPASTNTGKSHQQNHEEKTGLTLSSSDDRKPPIHMKQRSAGVFHIPDKMWKTSAFAAMPFNLKMSSNCAVTLSTIVRSSVSPACELTAALSSLISLLCSSSHRAYSTSNAKAPFEQFRQAHQNQSHQTIKKMK